MAYTRFMTHQEKIRGVNLGGWLILEKWMTPSVFRGTSAIDEYSFMQTDGADDKIQAHRSSFVTDEDFKWLAENGINAIRLPVGYWVLEDSGPYLSAAQFLDFAVDMCDKYHLKLLIDLHGAPGSQNGRDHSGRVGEIRWHDERLNQFRSIEVLESLAKRYYNRDCIWGYQLLNEPKIGLVQWRLRRYYRQAYRRMIELVRPGTKLVFHDAFTTFLMSGAIAPRRGYPVVIDRHWYHFLQLFRRKLPHSLYFKKLRLSKYLYRIVRLTQPLIIGEWSGVLDHETIKNLPKNDRLKLEQQNIDVQLKLYENETDGWFFWSYKTEKPDLWNFRALIEKGNIKLN